MINPFSVAAKFLLALDYDNLGNRLDFQPGYELTFNTEENRRKLTVPITYLVTEGWIPSQENIDFIVMGEQGEVAESMKKFESYKELDNALNEIFEKGAQ